MQLAYSCAVLIPIHVILLSRIPGSYFERQGAADVQLPLEGALIKDPPPPVAMQLGQHFANTLLFAVQLIRMFGRSA